MSEALRFKRLDRFNWIIIGGANKSARRRAGDLGANGPPTLSLKPAVGSRARITTNLRIENTVSRIAARSLSTIARRSGVWPGHYCRKSLLPLQTVLVYIWVIYSWRVCR